MRPTHLLDRIYVGQLQHTDAQEDNFNGVA